jgi:hypothetical protein
MEAALACRLRKQPRRSPIGKIELEVRKTSKRIGQAKKEGTEEATENGKGRQSVSS